MVPLAGGAARGVWGSRGRRAARSERFEKATAAPPAHRPQATAGSCRMRLWTSGVGRLVPRSRCGRLRVSSFFLSAPRSAGRPGQGAS
eukprot:8561679-Alexandrium_andersonii.AAC.1